MARAMQDAALFAARYERTAMHMMPSLCAACYHAKHARARRQRAMLRAARYACSRTAFYFMRYRACHRAMRTERDAPAIHAKMARCAR